MTKVFKVIPHLLFIIVTAIAYNNSEDNQVTNFSLVQKAYLLNIWILPALIFSFIQKSRLKFKIKNTSILLISLLIACKIKAQTFTLNGRVEGRDTGIIWFSYINSNQKEIKDTVYLNKGVFQFDGSIAGPTRAILLGNIKSRSMDDSNYTEMFIETGVMHISLVENDFKNFVLTGSETQSDMNLLTKQKKDINSRTEETKMDYSFMKTHLSSNLSAYLLNLHFDSRELSVDSAELFYNAFTSIVKNSSFGKEVHDNIIQRKASSIGHMVPDFSKEDISGKVINFSKFRNKKYVLLDFWASWCVPCRQENPRLRKLHVKYHSAGLNILSISWDSDTQAWKNAIVADSTGDWNHIQANIFKTPPPDNGMRQKFSLAAIPTLILIDNNGYDYRPISWF